APQKYIEAIAFSPNGRELAATGFGVIWLWDVASRRQRHEIVRQPAGFPSLAYSPDGKILAAGSTNHTIHMWDSLTRHSLQVAAGQPGGSAVVNLLNDGQTLIVLSESDQVLRLWNLPTLRELGSFSWPDPSGWHAAVSPDGRNLAVTDFGGSIY